VKALQSPSMRAAAAKHPWRLLYPGFFAPVLAQDNQSGFVHSKFAHTITRGVSGIAVREMGENWYIWTVVIELDKPIAITIETLDSSLATAVAAQSLALFLKAFETEIRDLVSISLIEEVWIQVSSYAAMPEDLQSSVNKLGATEMLSEQQVVVTRPTAFDSSSPTFVVLGKEFLARTLVGEGVGGSVQFLLGLATTELVYQLLRGEVDEEDIRPKIVSMVRRTLS
jgi:hypothetical protein